MHIFTAGVIIRGVVMGHCGRLEPLCPTEHRGVCCLLPPRESVLELASFCQLPALLASLFESGSHYVAQVGLELTMHIAQAASASWMPGAQICTTHHTWLYQDIFFAAKFRETWSQVWKLQCPLHRAKDCMQSPRKGFPNRCGVWITLTLYNSRFSKTSFSKVYAVYITRFV